LKTVIKNDFCSVKLVCRNRLFRGRKICTKNRKR